MDPLAPHTLTLARCARALVLTKTWRRDGSCESYDLAKRFDLGEVVARDLGELHHLLTRLLDKPRVCVLRGAIADPARVRGVRRLVHPDRETGEAPTLRDVPRAWLALDMDNVPLPAQVDVRDLAACGDAALRLLPKAFHGVAHIVAATASHGVKQGARLRLWFLLHRPTTGAELRRWLRDAAVDHAVFGAAQAIFTARPRFTGLADPVPNRLLLRHGAEAVLVPPPLALAPPPRPAPPPPPRANQGGGYGARALASAASRIMGAPISARHWTAVGQAKHLARLAARDIIAERDVIALVEAALEHAGKPRAEGRAIAEWAIAWARGSAA
jgi:hypothetical protein